MLLEKAFMPTPLLPIICAMLFTLIAEYMTNSSKETPK